MKGVNFLFYILFGAGDTVTKSTGSCSYWHKPVEKNLLSTRFELSLHCLTPGNGFFFGVELSIGRVNRNSYL